MLMDQTVQAHKVLVELSVIAFNGNRQPDTATREMLGLIEKKGLFFEHRHNVTCIEGEWDEISDIIFNWYRQLQMHDPQGYLQVSVR